MSASPTTRRAPWSAPFSLRDIAAAVSISSLVGSADTIVQQLRRYRDMGFDEVMVRHIVGDHGLMLQSFARIARDVMPRIRGL